MKMLKNSVIISIIAMFAMTNMAFASIGGNSGSESDQDVVITKPVINSNSGTEADQDGVVTNDPSTISNPGTETDQDTPTPTSVPITTGTFSNPGSSSDTGIISNPGTEDDQDITSPVQILSRMEVTPVFPHVTVGNTIQFSVIGKDQNGNIMTLSPVTWSTGDSNIATVNSSTGIVTAVASGTISITATAGNFSGSGYIIISSSTTTTPPPVITETPVLKQINISPLNATIALTHNNKPWDIYYNASSTNLDQFGNKISASIFWSSSNPAVATISSNSGAKTKSVGTTIITARNSDGSIISTTTLTVVDVIPSPITLIILSPKYPTISMSDNSLQLTAKAFNNNDQVNTQIYWQSYDESVATIDANGHVTAIAPGITVIRAYNGSIDDYTNLRVVELPIGALTINSIPNQTIEIGNSITFSATTTGGVLPIRYSLGTNVTSAVIDQTTGIFSWTATSTGTFTFDIIAKDSSSLIGNSTSTQVTITVGDIPTPTPEITPAIASFSSSSSGSFSGGSSSSGGSSILPAYTGVGACSYLDSYLKFGDNNDSAQITKLQTFLKNNQNIDVDINGIFDNKTLQAVKTFQSKYLADIMAPWGANTPSGYVFYTTKNKINEIYCKSTFALTPAQLAEITAYKNSTQIVTTPVSTPNITSSPSPEIIPSVIPTPAQTSNPNIGLNTNTNANQAAAVGSTSIAGKIGSFFKWLLGY